MVLAMRVARRETKRRGFLEAGLTPAHLVAQDSRQYLELLFDEQTCCHCRRR